MLRYVHSAEAVTTEHLQDFFVGWPNRPRRRGACGYSAAATA